MRSRALTVFVLLLLFVAFFPEQAGQAAQTIVGGLLTPCWSCWGGWRWWLTSTGSRPRPRWSSPRRRSARPPNRRAWDWLVLYVARPLWGFRVELAAALALLAAGGGWPAPRADRLAGVGGWGGGLLAIPEARRRILVVAHRARLRRRWATACRYAKLATASDRIPRIVKHALVPAGDRLLVRLPAGSFTAALAEAAEQVAVILDVREVRVARDADRASLARVTVVRRDPLHGAAPLAWPWLVARRCSLWQPVPVGVDEDGHGVTITLPERHVLLGGESGAGKSGGLALLEQLFQFAWPPVEAGELARHDHVDDAGSQVSHEVQELTTWLLALVARADAVIHVHADESPALRLDEVAAVAFLVLDVGLLAFTILAESAIDRRSHDATAD